MPGKRKEKQERRRVRSRTMEGPLRERIEWAWELYRNRAEEFLRDERLAGLLDSYRRACKKSGELRVEAGVVTQCGICEKLEGGSCCGAGIELRYGEWLLFMNLLLGAELPKKRAYADSCLFLGPAGCVLAARDVLCVNYMCARITDRCKKGKILELQEAEGEELGLLFLINEEIKKKADRIFAKKETIL